MKPFLLVVVVLVSFQAAAAQGKATMRDFSFMSGCWERRDDAKKLIVNEQWMSPAGTSILGMGRTVQGGRTTDWEFMRIEERPDGIYFVAKPKANATETDFKLIESTGSKFTFENKAHDFPKRVIYSHSKGKLTGRIEGDLMGIDFPMTRVKCG